MVRNSESGRRSCSSGWYEETITFETQSVNQEEEKTPSKMDVAPWDKHWIKRELDGFALYSMVFVEIQWYSMVFVGIQ